MTRSSTPTLEPKVLLDGLAMVESPRWHDGRLWFAHWGTGEIRAVDLEGRSEVTGHGPDGLGWTIDWLPDGRLLATGKELRVQLDGRPAPRSVPAAMRAARFRFRRPLRGRPVPLHLTIGPIGRPVTNDVLPLGAQIRTSMTDAHGPIPVHTTAASTAFRSV